MNAMVTSIESEVSLVLFPIVAAEKLRRDAAKEKAAKQG